MKKRFLLSALVLLGIYSSGVAADGVSEEEKAKLAQQGYHEENLEIVKIVGKVSMGKNWVFYTITKDDGEKVTVTGHQVETLIDWVGYKVELVLIKKISKTPTKAITNPFKTNILAIKSVKLVESPKLKPITDDMLPQLDYQDLADTYNSIRRVRELHLKDQPFYRGTSPMGPKRTAEEIKRLEWLMLSGTDVTDEQFEKLSHLPNVKKVVKLRYCNNLTAKAADSFKNLKYIEYLAMDGKYWTAELLEKTMKNTRIDHMSLFMTIDHQSEAWKTFLADHRGIKFAFRKERFSHTK